MTKHQFTSPVLETDTITTLSEKLIQTTAQLYESNCRLEKLQKERSEMLANISHDLRAPVTALRSAIDLLQAAPPATTAEWLSMLQMMDRRTAVLETLIQDMHTLFTVENPDSPLSFEQVVAAPFLEEYFYDTTLSQSFEDKETLLDMPETLNASIYIDISRMIRVLDNLFTNAAKYSGPGAKITLCVREVPPQTTQSLQSSFTADADSCLQIEVIDTGIGIPADALPHIFDRMYTVSKARTPGAPSGSGLGLCIVKTIIERFGGTISCESEPGKGSTFRILLPAKHPA